MNAPLRQSHDPVRLGAPCEHASPGRARRRLDRPPERSGRRESPPLACVVCAIALLAISHLAFSAEGNATRPNVLFVAVDDLRPELGCYGHPLVKSPNIDRLAARGMRFDRAYCQYPVCNPSRTSLLTGLRPDATGILDNATHFRTRLPDVITLPQLFRQHGYATICLGKIYHGAKSMNDPLSWDVAEHPEPTPVGRTGEGRNLTGGRVRWCRWLAAEGDDEDQPDGQIAREAVRLLEKHRDRPFFLAVGFQKPHDPFIAPKKYFDLYPPQDLVLPDDQPGRTPDPPLAIASPWKAEFDKFTDQERREFLRAYFAGTSFVDAQLGKVLETLDRLKLTDNTIIFFWGDHGYHLGERGWWNKNTVFELSARAPLIVVAPGMKQRAASCSRLVEFIDIYPTLVELCGLPLSDKLQGTSFRPLLDDPQQPGKRAAYTQVQRGKSAGRSVRTDRWRYTEWDEGRQGVELYDHEHDPHEMSNRADDPKLAAVIDELKQLLRATKAE